MAKKASQKRRWYSRYPHLEELMNTCEKMPQSVQAKIADEFYTAAHVYYDVLKVVDGLRHVDDDIQAHREKSTRKQRWYDAFPGFHDALNILLEFPEVGLTHFDRRCARILMDLSKENPEGLGQVS